MKAPIVVLGLAFLCACQPHTQKTSTYSNKNLSDHTNESQLERLKDFGEIVMVTRNGPTTYFLDAQNRPAGLEYDLAKLFAEHLGVLLEVRTASNLEEISSHLHSGEANFSAAGIPITYQNLSRFKFSASYQKVGRYVVYRKGKQRPTSLAELNGKLEIVDSRVLETQLKKFSSLDWRISKSMNYENLMEKVWKNNIDYTIVHSHEFQLSRHYFPEVRKAFPINKQISLAWAFPKNSDDSLRIESVRFFEKIKQNGQLAQVLERYYGPTQHFNYFGARKFLIDVEKVLPKYKNWFRRAAMEHKIDWRLLAAVGYQESHWNPKAVSPTGVRGLMMLTRSTARAVRVNNRRNPKQSIYGGAMVLKELLNILPQEIHGADRTWFALAAYNVGIGHLNDARNITAQLGGDPNVWVDVQEHLPLLSDKKWYQKTKFGYARGHEPVKYVSNIRRYYRTLKWVTDNSHSYSHGLEVAKL